MMKKKQFTGLALVLAASCWGTSAAQAQPDIDNGTKADNPPNWGPGDFRQGGRRGNFGGLGGRIQMLTPEQMQQRQQEMRLADIRRQLTGAGYTDEALQTTVVDYFKAEQEARAKITEKYQKVMVSLRDKATPDTQLAGQLNELRAAVDDEKARQEKALTDLRAKLQLDQKPRLDALLMTLGITGNERALATQNNGLDGLLNMFGPMGNLGRVMPGQGENFFILPDQRANGPFQFGFGGRRGNGPLGDRLPPAPGNNGPATKTDNKVNI